MIPLCNICKKPLQLISEFVLCAECYKRETENAKIANAMTKQMKLDLAGEKLIRKNAN